MTAVIKGKPSYSCNCDLEDAGHHLKTLCLRWKKWFL